MDTISSGEFRKTYAKLAKPVIVTVNGHPIGVWSPRELSPDGVPVWPSDKLMDETHVWSNAGDTPAEVAKSGWRPMTQSDRDAILRRVNKS